MADDIAKADPERALKAMYGMALQKQNALCHPYPSKLPLIEKYGYDGKQISHIYRIYYICVNYIEKPKEWYGRYIMIDGDTTESIKQFLIDLKTYNKKFNVETVKGMAEKRVNDIKNLVDDAIATHNYTVNTAVYDKLDTIKAKIIKTHFSEELHS